MAGFRLGAVDTSVRVVVNPDGRYLEPFRPRREGGLGRAKAVGQRVASESGLGTAAQSIGGRLCPRFRFSLWRQTFFAPMFCAILCCFFRVVYSTHVSLVCHEPAAWDVDKGFRNRYLILLAILVLSGTTILNLIPDFISLLKTRYVIGLMRHSSSMSTIALLLVDALGSALIGSLTLFMGILFWS
jgi:hypothetical protein